MENYLLKIVKWFPRKIKKIIMKVFKSLINNSLDNFKSELNNSLSRHYLINKLMLKQISETISEVEFIGQELQDMYAYLYFKGKKDGYFIDIGAYDGITISNTFALEKIGWKGVCVEPVPEIYDILKKNRKCECINAAIYNEDGKTLDFIQTKGGRSGFITDMNDSMISAAESEGIIGRYSVKTITFENLMRNNNVKHVDFMSIDVEGAEFAVLDSIDFNKYKFDLITIENNHGKNKLRDYMFSKGYKILLDLGVDILFIPQNKEIGMYWWTDQ
jgi:FkbM family methyltransferase